MAAAANQTTATRSTWGDWIPKWGISPTVRMPNLHTPHSTVKEQMEKFATFSKKAVEQVKEVVEEPKVFHAKVEVEDEEDDFEKAIKYVVKKESAPKTLEQILAGKSKKEAEIMDGMLIIYKKSAFSEKEYSDLLRLARSQKLSTLTTG